MGSIKAFGTNYKVVWCKCDLKHTHSLSHRQSWNMLPGCGFWNRLYVTSPIWNRLCGGFSEENKETWHPHNMLTLSHPTPLEPPQIITLQLSEDEPTSALRGNTTSNSTCFSKHTHTHAITHANTRNCCPPPAYLSFEKTAFLFHLSTKTRHACAIVHSVWSWVLWLPTFHPSSALVPWSFLCLFSG